MQLKDYIELVLASTPPYSEIDFEVRVNPVGRIDDTSPNILRFKVIKEQPPDNE